MRQWKSRLWRKWDEMASAAFSPIRAQKANAQSDGECRVVTLSPTSPIEPARSVKNGHRARVHLNADDRCRTGKPCSHGVRFGASRWLTENQDWFRLVKQEYLTRQATFRSARNRHINRILSLALTNRAISCSPHMQSGAVTPAAKPRAKLDPAGPLTYPMHFSGIG